MGLKILVTGSSGLIGSEADGSTLFRTYQTDLPAQSRLTIKRGHNRWRCLIPKGLLNGGDYFISPRIGIHNHSWTVNEDAVLQFQITLDHATSSLWSSRQPGMIAPILQWKAALD
jgi:hypothetical protein